MKKIAYGFAIANVIAWMFFLWSGRGAIEGIQAQHVHGYPSNGQFFLYLDIPPLMLAVALALLVLTRWIRWPEITIALAFIHLFVAFIYMVAASGGI